MAEGRSRAAWDHTAALLAMLANTCRDPKKRRRPWDQRDFHPHRRRARKRPPKKGSLGVLKAVFVDGRGDDVLRGVES